MARAEGRPLALGAVAGAAAHHSFELASGVGLVLQPELGLGRSAAVWVGQFGGWALLTRRRGRLADAVLAVLAGASLSGVGVHFVLWSWRKGPGGLPLLTEAEGLTPGQLPAYNAILWFWATTAAGSLALETPRRSRRWALLGLVTLPVFVVSARHHFDWVKEQAVGNPAWWNRGLRPVSPSDQGRAAGTNERSSAS
ncbi:MAG: hypothetical protein ACRD0Z_07005 [Acidimicrobiales bacterium]